MYLYFKFKGQITNERRTSLLAIGICPARGSSPMLRTRFEAETAVAAAKVFLHFSPPAIEFIIICTLLDHEKLSFQRNPPNVLTDTAFRLTRASSRILLHLLRDSSWLSRVFFTSNFSLAFPSQIF